MRSVFVFIGLLMTIYLNGQITFVASEVQIDQDIYFRHFTKANGLPSDVVKYVMQDNQGYIWIGTDNGLVRFDGQRMVVFQHNPDNPASIGDNMVFTIFQSRDSLIWVGTKNGFSVFNPSKATFTNYSPYAKAHFSFPGVEVNHFYEDENADIWIATTNGLFQFNRGNEVFYGMLQSPPGSAMQDNWRSWFYRILPHPADENLLFVSSQGGLFLVDKKKQELHAELTADWPKNRRFMTQSLYLESDSLLWNGEWGTGLRKLNINTMKWTVYHFPGDYFQSALYIEGKGEDELWITTPDRGLLIFDKKNESFRMHIKSDANPRSILSNILHCNLLIDRKGDVWIGGKEGLNLLDKNYRSFNRVQLPFGAGTAWSFFSDENKLYVGVNHRLNLLVQDKETGLWSHIPAGEPDVRPNTSVNGIFKDKRGTIWVSTSRNGLLYIDKKTQTLRVFRDKHNQTIQFEGNTIPLNDIVEDNNHNLWINAPLHGFVRIDANRSKFSIFTQEKDNPDGLMAGDLFFEVMADEKNRLWIASRRGFAVYDIGREAFLDTFHQGLGELGISRDQGVGGFATDRLGRIWIGLHGKGLLRITENEQGVDYKLFHTAHGLNDPNISKIAVDSKGNFWIVNEGLLFFNPYTEQFNSFDTRNALHTNKSIYDNIYIDEEDNIFLNTPGGFETKHADEMALQGGIINLLIEQIEINGADVRIVGQLHDIRHLLLGAFENNVKFTFSALCFQDTDRILYQYQLHGYDNEPNNLTRQGVANYTNLPPGDYRFELRAIHRGVWFGENAIFEFTIRPHFYQTLWFKALSLVVVVLLVVLIIRIRTIQIRRKEKFRADFAKRLAEAEMKSLRAQMNPHFIFNSLNSINTFILKNETDVASEYLTKFSRLIRAVLNNSKNKLVSLEDELDALRIYLELEQIRFNNKFTFSIIIDQYLDTNRVFVPPLLLQPYVENAVWHGLMYKDSHGSISISAHKQDGEILFAIQDDGIGREKAAEYKSAYELKGKSLGMKITADRIETINQMYKSKAEINIIDLYDTRQQAAGTRVTIKLPIINNPT